MNALKGFTILVFIIVAVCLSFKRNIVWIADESIWMNSIKKSSSKGRPYNAIGKALVDKGAYDDAFIYLKKVVELEPSNSIAHNNISYILYKKKNYNEARQAAIVAIMTWPDNAEAHNNLGLIYLEEGLLDNAIAEFKYSIRLKGSPQSMVNLGVAYDKKGLLDEAIMEYKSALAIEPWFKDDVIYNIVAAYTNRGFDVMAISDSGSAQYKEAIKLFKEALLYNPDDSYATYGVALALDSIGERDEARQWWKKFLRVADPMDPAKEEAMRRLKEKVE